MRTIILDTETTGLNCNNDRLVEIGCVEIDNLGITISDFHLYVNPGMPIPAEATAVHGITNDFVKDKPAFKDIGEKFLDFVQNATLVAHNAKFDMGFLNAELVRNGMKKLDNQVIDTLSLARKTFPGSPANLDALAKRFNISLHERQLHGALVDAKILAKVYIALKQPAQSSLFSESKPSINDISYSRSNRKIAISEEELNLHQTVMSELQKNKM